MKVPKKARVAEKMKSSKRKRLANVISAKDDSPCNSSEHSSEEPAYKAVPEEILQQKPSLFDDLLRALGSNNNKSAKLYNKRKREQEGRSDSEDHEDDALGSSLDEGEEIDGESDISMEDTEGDGKRENATAEIMEPRDNAENATLSDSDTSHGSEDEGQHVDEETQDISSFQCHLGKILTSEEIETLLKKKLSFKWEMPVTDFPLSKWLGTGDPLSKGADDDIVDNVKPKLYNHWLDIYKASGPNKFSSSRERFFSLCNSYRDIMHCNKKPFYIKGNEEDSSFMDAYIMHALNHVYRTRDLVLKNEAMAKHQLDQKEEILCSDTFLDQGFTRPKVLFLLPLASIALRVVKRLIELTPISNKANVEHLSRFHKEFGATDEVQENGEEDGSFKSKKSTKPKDFESLFGGNNKDLFMLGIKFTKRSVKLYSDFYSSDIIVASPLGLITKIADTEVEKEKDVDFLSSIEVLVIDHADVIAMQNWSHVDTAVAQLNRTPLKQHGTDITRIRPWHLNGHAHYYRQTILLGSFVNPDMNAFFNKLCLNYEGKVKSTSEYKGVLPKILLQARQVYERFDASSVMAADDARLDFFSKKVYPKIKGSIEGGTMIFISSYFEFVRVRNFLKSQDASFCLLGEYTKPEDISRARVWFYEGERKIMLYTERAHFYHRYKIRGIQNIIIYSLPERKEFYPEIINMLDESKNMTCSVLFSRFDQLRLERIVGTAAAKKMLRSDKRIFVFC